jgi:hypothetical protein
MSANVCSITAASNARVVMKRMAVGQSSYGDQPGAGSFGSRSRTADFTSAG